MKLLNAITICTLTGAAALFVSSCSIQSLPGPQYIPQSTAKLGPVPEIPEAWYGCWRGTIDNFDTVTPLSPAISASQIKAQKQTLEFCFTMKPDGTSQMDLTDLEVAGHKAKITHFDNRFTSIGPTVDRASLRNHVTAESVINILWIFPMHMQQDVYADEDIQMISHDVVMVKGKQVVVMGTNMIASMTFHTNFYRVGTKTL